MHLACEMDTYDSEVQDSERPILDFRFLVLLFLILFCDRSVYFAQAGPKLTVLLPQVPEC